MKLNLSYLDKLKKILVSTWISLRLPLSLLSVRLQKQLVKGVPYLTYDQHSYFNCINCIMFVNYKQRINKINNWRTLLKPLSWISPLTVTKWVSSRGWCCRICSAVFTPLCVIVSGPIKCTTGKWSRFLKMGGCF